MPHDNFRTVPPGGERLAAEENAIADTVADLARAAGEEDGIRVSGGRSGWLFEITDCGYGQRGVVNLVDQIMGRGVKSFTDVAFTYTAGTENTGDVLIAAHDGNARRITITDRAGNYSAGTAIAVITPGIAFSCYNADPSLGGTLQAYSNLRPSGGEGATHEFIGYGSNFRGRQELTFEVIPAGFLGGSWDGFLMLRAANASNPAVGVNPAYAIKTNGVFERGVTFDGPSVKVRGGIVTGAGSGGTGVTGTFQMVNARNPLLTVTMTFVNGILTFASG